MLDHFSLTNMSVKDLIDSRAQINQEIFRRGKIAEDEANYLKKISGISSISELKEELEELEPTKKEEENQVAEEIRTEKIYVKAKTWPEIGTKCEEILSCIWNYEKGISIKEISKKINYPASSIASQLKRYSDLCVRMDENKLWYPILDCELKPK